MSVVINIPVAGGNGSTVPANVNASVAGGQPPSGGGGPQALKFNVASNSMYLGLYSPGGM